MKKYLFVILCIALSLFSQNVVPQNIDYPFEEEIRHFEQMDIEKPPLPNAVLFIGSSSIRMWKSLEEDMQPIPVINRGFGGSQAHQVLHYMDRIVFPYKPEAIVFYEGDNDIASGKKPTQFIAECKTFLDSVQMRLPNVQIFFLSVKPSYARIKLEPQRKVVNELLKQFCESNDDANFIDVSSIMFAKDGTLKKDIFLEDQLHMNENGYQLWTAIIKERLKDYFNN